MRPDGKLWRQDFAPLGIPTAIIADDPELLAPAREAYAEWLVEGGEEAPAIEIRICRPSAPSEGVSHGIAAEGSRLSLTIAGAGGEADSVSGRGVCQVSAGAAWPSLAREALDPILLFLLTRRGRIPVHAAGIVIGDRPVVLAGPSGAGKSSLAHAAARRGLKILSDDTVYVEPGRAARVWGWPRPVHLFPEDAPPGDHQVRERLGKRKLVVPLAAGSSATGPFDHPRLVMLEPGQRLALRRIATGAIQHEWPPLEAGFDLLPDESMAAMNLLAADGAWRLTLADDPGAAIELLVAQFGGGGAA